MESKKIINRIIEHCKTLTLSTDYGKFLADKSYGFDTMFFACRFINRYRFGNIFQKSELKERANAYFSDLFCLTPSSSQVGNYMTEACALLKFAKIISEEKRGVFKIEEQDLLSFIASGPENAYVFIYLLTYSVFNHDGLWITYKNFCTQKTLKGKQKTYNKIVKLFSIKDSRILDSDKLWALFVPKYPMNVLNYANREPVITRTGIVKEAITTIEDIALNVNGTRANYSLPKKNSYIEEMSISYILNLLQPYLVNNIPRSRVIQPLDSFSRDVADTKMDMFDSQDGKEISIKKYVDKYNYVKGVKVRTVQGEFRAALLKTTPHICPICGFKFEEFLIASHIKPYSKCEDSYDAMNSNNGLLMCPICDKLFESANYMTIDYKTGRVVYDKKLEQEKDFSFLKNKIIHPLYIDCERRHYLKWHNDFYKSKH